MSNRRRLPLRFLAPLAGALALSSPAPAQTDPASELDPLAEASAEVAPGLALAREQISARELVAALATVERVILTHPEAAEPFLLHASLLCRLDDPAGAQAEIEQFAGHQISDQAWAELTAACGEVPRPTATSGAGATMGDGR